MLSQMRKERGKREEKEFSCILWLERILIRRAKLTLVSFSRFRILLYRSFHRMQRSNEHKDKDPKNRKDHCCSSVIYLNGKKGMMVMEKERKKGEGAALVLPRSCPARVIFFNVHDSTKIAMIIFRRVVRGPLPSPPLFLLDFYGRKWYQ